MTGGILNLLPFPVNPTLVAGVGGAVAGMALGAFLAHSWDGIALSRAEKATATVQSAYDGYKASIAIASAQATQHSMDERAVLQATVRDLQAMLAEQQRVSNAKSKQLRDILSAAKPGDERPVGPAAASYYDSLRNAP